MKSLDVLTLCLNGKVLAGLGLAVLAMVLFVPRFAAFAPLLLVFACPLSMLLMMRGMRKENYDQKDHSRDSISQPSYSYHMHDQKNAGFSTTGVVVGVIVVVALIAAGRWYFTRQQTASDVGEDTSAPTAQSHRSFTLKSDASSKSFQPKQPTTYTFSIIDDQGTTVKDFATVHEKIMHLIVVRKDLAEFQHVHPVFNKATGLFTLANLTFPTDGPYRIFPDFTPASGQMGPDGTPLGVTLHEDVNVGNLANDKPQPLADTRMSKTFQGYQVQLMPNPTPVTANTSTTLTFAVNQAGKPVTNLEKYLGALGHTVVLREGDLEFLHTHALDENVGNQTGKVDFAVTFPTAAKYAVFSQFQHQGKVLTTHFVVTAESRAAGTNQQTPSSAPQHNAPQH